MDSCCFCWRRTELLKLQIFFWFASFYILQHWKNALWMVSSIVLLAVIKVVMSSLPAARPGWEHTFVPLLWRFYGMQSWSNCSSSQQHIRGRDITNTNQFVGFPISCNGSKTCPGKCCCLLDWQIGQTNTGNTFSLAFKILNSVVTF